MSHEDQPDGPIDRRDEEGRSDGDLGGPAGITGGGHAKEPGDEPKGGGLGVDPEGQPSLGGEDG